MMKWCVVCFLFFCSSCSTEVNQALKSASGNKMELYKVFMHYRFVDRDSNKYKAALFLIENMKYHYSRGKIPQDHSSLEQWRAETDSIYFNIVGYNKAKNYNDTLKKIQKIRHKELDSLVMPEVKNDTDLYIDCQYLSSTFIIEHIDNAFRVWKTSKFARHLTYDEFKEYILPYRSIRGNGFHTNGNEYNNLFAKYIFSDTSSSLHEHIGHYGSAISGMRTLNGPVVKTDDIGIYESYVYRSRDCVGIANYECNILRACGIPTVVEYNICYPALAGKHFYCNVYDTNKRWEIFDLSGVLSKEHGWKTKTTLNIYRELYGAQKNTPFFLKNSDEYVPPLLSSPCMQDVTSDVKKTVSIELPFSIETSNQLAYLGTFSKNSDGLTPVTWGEIDSLSSKVLFEYAIPNIIYFPIYYPDKDFKVFGEPFYVKIDSSGDVSLLPIPDIDNSQDSLMTLMINRKYPQKPNMIKVAQNLVGGRFLGANKHNFSDAKVLYEIKEPPKPYFLHYPFKNRKSYKHYRFQAPAKHPNAHISMIEWITKKDFNYDNAHKVSRPHIIDADGIDLLKNESSYVKIINEKTWEKMKNKKVYDGNMQTTPGAYSSFTYRFQAPQIITALRFAPWNADNGIRAGDRYELFYWKSGWQNIGDCYAEYEYVTFENIPANKLYWLVNTTRGKEELPFTMVDGKQCFLYYDMLNK